MAGLQEKQLGQLRPANTTAASLYSPGVSTTTIIKTITVVNTGGVNAKYRIFVDDDGSTFDESTALFWDTELISGETDAIDLFFAMNNSSGNLGVRTSVANALTFTAFGAEIT